MTAPWMPPLPEPDGYMRETPVWAEDSMRQAQADAARAALEQAAKVCRSRAERWRIRVVPMLGIATEFDVAADAIEQMAKEIT